MKATCCSGRCAIPAESPSAECGSAGRRRAARSRRGWVLAILMLPVLAAAADAPPPVPPEAEAAYQDLTEETREPVALDEAVFTEISPLAVPEVGIRLPEDQEL